jgi:hypothetical protein
VETFAVIFALCLLLGSIAWATNLVVHPAVPLQLTPASTSASGSLTVGSFSTATAVPSTFWGVNVAAPQPFGSTDAQALAKTPITYTRFPGGIYGEEFNYTSGVITSDTGSQSRATTSTSEFVTACKDMHCNALLQLPAEIDQPATAAYYAKYVVHTLGFQPAYWEIGNSVPGWNHFGVPWSKWGSETNSVTASEFATVVKNYIAAVKAVDSAAKFVALGIAMGTPDYGKTWIETLVSADGHELAGVSIHSYVMGGHGGPSNPTDAELFAGLTGQYSLPDQVKADESFILQACSTCSGIQLFVTEINAVENSTLVTLLPTFAGSLYIAAETTQGLRHRVPNLDWFAYDSSYPGSLSTSHLKWQMQYYLFADIMSHLMKGYLPNSVTGPNTFYAAPTYSATSGLALLLINVNTTTSLNVALGHSGIKGGSTVQKFFWDGTTEQPTESSWALQSSITLAPKTLVLLVATPSELT